MKKLLAAATLTGLATQAVADSAVLRSQDGSWTYDLTAYLFAPVSTSGTSTISDQSADIDMDLSDALEVLDGTISGRFEAWNGDFGLAFEGNYLGISDDQSVTGSGPLGRGLDVDVDVEQLWLSFLGAWRFANGVTASGNPFSTDVQAGARYNSLQQDVDISGDRQDTSLGGTETWWEPVVALRGAMQINENWRLAGIVDASGFGTNGNDLAWSASLGADWQAWDNTSIKFGWRYYSIDFSTDRDGGEFAYDVTQNGPFIGLSWVFD